MGNRGFLRGHAWLVYLVSRNGHAIGKKVQPFIDDFFGVGPKTGQNPRDKNRR